MKKRFITVLALLAFAFVLAPAALPTVNGQEIQMEQATTTSNTEETTQPKDPAAEPQARLDKRKADQKTKLTNAQKTRLKGKCKAAQGKVSSVSGRAKGIQTSRAKVHANVVNRLTNLSAKLEAKDADTVELNTMIAELKTKITTFETDLAAYLQTIADLETMDCVSDPEGFKASLDAARTALETVHNDAKAIRSYLTDTIKPQLVAIRAQLAGSQGEEN